MNGNPDTSTAAEFLNVTRALRFALVAVVLGVSYPNIRCALALNAFQQIYHDMLGGKPLPADASFVTQARFVLVALSVAFPIFALISLFVRSLSRSIYFVGWLIIAVFVQLFFTWHAATGPLFQIIQNMPPAP